MLIFSDDEDVLFMTMIGDDDNGEEDVLFLLRLFEKKLAKRLCLGTGS
jgi:hypothetical protein